MTSNYCADKAPQAEIFRACDIRGVVGESLTPNVAFSLGQSFGTLAQKHGQNRVVIGRDGRHSGPELSEALIAGLMTTGMQVIDCGQVPTPVLYYATFALETGTGIMITGSHNPANYNGFKLMIEGKTLALEAIQSLYQAILDQDLMQGVGSVETMDIIPQYITRIVQDVTIARPLKLVVDCGNGVVGVLAENFFRELNCEIIPLYCEVDGDFPNHHPDPGQPANLQDVITKVKAEKADLGIAFDGDGDRLGLVTNQGEIIWPDRLMMLFVEDVLKRQPGSSIIYDVKCSKLLGEHIRRLGGTPVMYKTGHALIKGKMQSLGAQLSGEMSGHFFFKERWYGFDDALYAAARLLEILSHQAQDLHSLLAQYPDSVNTPEINVAIHEAKKFDFIASLQQTADFSEATLVTIDGLRAEWSDGWGLVRASNTTPSLVLRFEADSESALARIQQDIKALMLGIAPELSLPF